MDEERSLREQANFKAALEVLVRTHRNGYSHRYLTPERVYLFGVNLPFVDFKKYLQEAEEKGYLESVSVDTTDHIAYRPLRSKFSEIKELIKKEPSPRKKRKVKYKIREIEFPKVYDREGFPLVGSVGGEAINETLNNMRERDAKIIKEYYGMYTDDDPKSLKEIGEMFGISSNRASHLLQRGLSELFERSPELKCFIKVKE